MPEESNGYDWRERMRRIEDAMALNAQKHERFDRDLHALHRSLVEQKTNIDKLLEALRLRIDSGQGEAVQ